LFLKVPRFAGNIEDAFADAESCRKHALIGLSKPPTRSVAMIAFPMVKKRKSNTKRGR